MRDDIVGMLRNAIDHGGNPLRVAQSLINSGYPMKDVKEAFDYVVSTNPQLQNQNFSSPRPENQQPPQQSSSHPPIQKQESQQRTQGSIQVNSYNPNQSIEKKEVKHSFNQQPQTQKSQYIPSPNQQPQQLLAELKPLKPLPSNRTNPSVTGKIIVMVAILLILVLSLITVIVFKDKILDLFNL